MEKNEVFAAKTVDEAKALAAKEFGVDEVEIEFQIVEQPVKKLFGGTKGDFRVRAIYKSDKPAATPAATASPAPKPIQSTAPMSKPASPTAPKSATKTETLSEIPSQLTPIVEYLSKILTGLGIEGFEMKVRISGENNIIDIVGENLGIIIGRRGETLDSLQYLAILANNRGNAENQRVLIDCNGYREKRAETLESLAIRTSNKVIKQGRRITLEPMNPYERRIIHSKIAEIDGVYSNSIGEEPYRKVVISAEVAKKRAINNDRNDRSVRNERSNTVNRNSNRFGGGGGQRSYNNRQRGPMISGRDYKQSNEFSTSFERDYKRTADTEISQDTVDVEKNASLYGKIEL